MNQPAPIFNCNHCLTELKLFQAPTTDPRARTVPKQYLTSCFHVLCQACRVKGKDVCATCKRKCNFMEIGTKQMPKHFQWYFMPASVAANHCVSVMKFQRDETKLIAARITSRNEHLTKKRDAAVREYNETKHKYQHSMRAYRKITIIHKKLFEEKKRRNEEAARRKQQQRRQQQLDPRIGRRPEQSQRYPEGNYYSGTRDRPSGQSQRYPKGPPKDHRRPSNQHHRLPSSSETNQRRHNDFYFEGESFGSPF